MGKLGVLDDMAVDLELLGRDSGIRARGEEKHIPIVVAHDEGKSGETEEKESVINFQRVMVTRSLPHKERPSVGSGLLGTSEEVLVVERKKTTIAGRYRS